MSPLYVVMITVLIIWLGIFLYLIGLDRKLSRLGREMDRK